MNFLANPRVIRKLGKKKIGGGGVTEIKKNKHSEKQ